MGYVMLVIAALVLFGGVNDTLTRRKNPEPVAMTVAEFAQSNEQPVYVKLTALLVGSLVGVMGSHTHAKWPVLPGWALLTIGYVGLQCQRHGSQNGER